MGKRKRKDGAQAEITTEAAPTIADTDQPKAKKLQQRRSLFVRSLAPGTTTENLIEHFSQSYAVKHATAVVDSATKLCKGYGFVTFTDAEDAQGALKEFSGSTLLGKKIFAELAEPRHREMDDTLTPELVTPESRKAAAEQARAKNKAERLEQLRPPKLIIRNLPWSIKKPEHLEKLFLSYGKVKHVVLPVKRPGLLSGFGFVTLRGRKNAEKAIAGVNGKQIEGRTIAVDWAVEKNVWEQQQISEVTEQETAVGSDSESVSSVEDANFTVASDSSGNEQGSENDGVSDDLDEKDQRKTHTEPEDYSATVFIRNLSFTNTDEDLHTHFKQFGPVRYARIVVDPTTERSRGTGFVCFYKSDDAKQCLRDAPIAAKVPGKVTVLQGDSDDPSGKYTLDGRVLSLTKAVERGEASKLASDNKVTRDAKDKRRLFLLSEGTISSKSALYKLLSDTEIAMRESSAKQRKKLVQSNASLHLSLTRLSIRNIPFSVTSRDLKALAREAVVGFAQDVKEGKRERLAKEEIMRGGETMLEAEKSRKKSGKGIVKQAKIVYEDRTGSKIGSESGGGRSRGYGFVEYHTHRSALMGLRWLNGHLLNYNATEKTKNMPDEVKERKKRLIVEFAIENAQVVRRRRDREDKSRAPKDSLGKSTTAATEALTLFEAAPDESVASQKSRGNNRTARQRKQSVKDGLDADSKVVDQTHQSIMMRKRFDRRARKRGG